MLGLKFICAPDSFKGSLSSQEVAEAFTEGILNAFPKANVTSRPLADGGEGSLETILAAYGGERVSMSVWNPLAEEVQVDYGIIDNGCTAVFESAQSLGLPQIALEHRNTKESSSYGLGQQMLDALENPNINRWIICLGGSATVDGGIGMLAALGACCVDRHNKPVSPDGKGLLKLSKIDLSGLPSKLKDLQITVACDVDAPLLGPMGPALRFGKQKGAAEEDCLILEEGLHRLEAILYQHSGIRYGQFPGAGAAGGIAACLHAYLGAELTGGFEFIAEALDLQRALSGATFVFSGEGCVDSQTLQGKVPAGVARYARHANVRCLLFSACLGEGWERIKKLGVEGVFELYPEAPQQLPSKTETHKLLVAKVTEVCHGLKQELL